MLRRFRCDRAGEERGDVVVRRRAAEQRRHRRAQSRGPADELSDQRRERRFQASGDDVLGQDVAGVVQQSARDRRGDLPFPDRPPVLRVATQPGAKQRHVAPRRVEDEPPVAEINQGHAAKAQRRLLEDVHVDLGDVPAPLQAGQAAEIGGVRVFVERPVDEVAAAGGAQIGEPAGRRAGDRAAQRVGLGVEAVAGAGQPFEGLDDGGVPAADVAGEGLENQRRAGAAAIEDRLRDIGAPALQVQRREEPGSDQVAEIRHRPVVGGVDLRVFPQPVDAAAGDRRLHGGQLDDRAQDPGVLRQPVLGAVNLRDPVPQLLGVILREAVVGGTRNWLWTERHRLTPPAAPTRPDRHPRRA